MNAGARFATWFALLTLVVVAFSFTIRVCGATEVRASDFEPLPGEPGLWVMPEVGGGAPSCQLSEGDQYAQADVTRAYDGWTTTAGGAGFGTIADARPAEDTSGDELGLHSLKVWDAPDDSPYLYVSFTPISLESFFDGVAFRRAVVGDEEIEVADVAPTLDPAHVGVNLDGRPLRVESLEWYYAGYSDLSGADTKYMPVCLLGIERPVLEAGAHTIEVIIEDADTGSVGQCETEFECDAWDARL